MPIRTTYTPFGRPAAYDVGEVLVELKTGGSFTTHLSAGYYEISVIGAGGGGGGGSWKSGHKHAGGGGGSGAGFVGVTWLSGGEYTFKCGQGGAGGANAEARASAGFDGGNSEVIKDGTRLILTQGGAGGWGARSRSYVTASGRPTGEAGKLTLSSAFTYERFSVKSNGNAGVSDKYGAPGAAVDGVHGVGGIGERKKYGLPGGNGYIKVSYLGLED